MSGITGKYYTSQKYSFCSGCVIWKRRLLLFDSTATLVVICLCPTVLKADTVRKTRWAEGEVKKIPCIPRRSFVTLTVSTIISSFVIKIDVRENASLYFLLFYWVSRDLGKTLPAKEQESERGTAHSCFCSSSTPLSEPFKATRSWVIYVSCSSVESLSRRIAGWSWRHFENEM